MLLEFSVGNFLSFKEKQTLSLIASGISDYKETNTFVSGRQTLLKGAVIYGANASGKSNLIRAMSTMKKIVVLYFYQSSTSSLEVTPFLLNTETENSPSFFEILFQISDVRYRYGFEVTNKEVVSEWLYESKKSAEKFLFIREGEGIELAKNYKEGQNLESKTRQNALFLSVVDQFNGEIAKKIMNWFNLFYIFLDITHENFELATLLMLEKDNTAKALHDFYYKLDLGFESLSVNLENFDYQRELLNLLKPVNPSLNKDIRGDSRFNIKTRHKKFDKNDTEVGEVEFEMRNQESAGTNKIFNMSGIFLGMLNLGGVLVIDELDSSLHPLLTLAITKLFNSDKDNSQNAQLIFTTHDTNLLTYGRYRRDQIYFVEKDKYGASNLYSLVEYREEDGEKVRKDRSFESDYIQGRYGAVPYLGDLSKIALEWQES